jgi:hypothetical protein
MPSLDDIFIPIPARQVPFWWCPSPPAADVIFFLHVAHKGGSSKPPPCLWELRSVAGLKQPPNVLQRGKPVRSYLRSTY